MPQQMIQISQVIKSKKVSGQGLSDEVDFGTKKIKKVVGVKPVSITHSVVKSYTIPIFLYDRNERLIKE